MIKPNRRSKTEPNRRILNGPHPYSRCKWKKTAIWQAEQDPYLPLTCHNSFYLPFNYFKAVVKWRCCDIRVQHRFQNITCWAWQAAPKVYLPTLALPLVLQPCLTKVSYISRTQPKDISCWAGQVRVLFCLSDCCFFRIHLQWDKWLCCSLDRLKS